MSIIAKIAVDKAAFHFDKLFDYLVPLELQDRVTAGMRVTVPFGQANRKRQGMVFAVEQAAPAEQLKPISAVLDEHPLLTGELLRLAEFLAEQTYCALYDAVKCMLPSGLNYKIQFRYTVNPDRQQEAEFTAEQQRIIDYLLPKKQGEFGKKIIDELGFTGEVPLERLVGSGVLLKEEAIKRRLGDKSQVMVRLSDNAAAPETLMPKLTEKQRQVVEFLLGCGEGESGTAALREINYYLGISQAVCDGLVRKGVLEYYDVDLYRTPFQPDSEDAEESEIRFTDEQRDVVEALSHRYMRHEAAVSLLHGITGSGKTLIYIELIRRVLADGRQAIMLVPEISLTPQAVHRFRRVFGDQVAILHSGLSVGERMDEWRRIRRGEAPVVVGTRSAVFAPLDRLGLIIIDEEQESTYKSESAPRYHTREVAKFRCKYGNAELLLASATPSVESFHATQTAPPAYNLYTLNSRYGDAVLPEVHIVDMKQEAFDGRTGLISELLYQELTSNLQSGRQSMLLLNRRGYNTVVKCSECGETAVCPNCNIALTYHRANEKLMCHYCGHAEPVLGNCTACGSRYIRYEGAGTQRFQEELSGLFPEARILRMDADTTMSKLAYEKAFLAFAAGDYDIMLGTQMIAKGLDFPNVTLVGVLMADSTLFGDDFRSYERTFSLLTQVVGRCGRSDRKGRAVIQTFSPENRVIELAAAQDYRSFYEYEIANRSIMLYPPFCDICEIGFSGEDEKSVVGAAQLWMARWKELVQSDYSDLPLRAYGPVPSYHRVISRKFRYKIIIKCRNTRRFRALTATVLKETATHRTARNVSIYADHYFSGII